MTRAILVLAACLALPAPAAAQVQALSLTARVVFYGDDTEYSNPFRTGETLLGTFGTLTLDAKMTDRLTLRAGVFGDTRHGSERAFERVRPVFSLVIREGQSTFVMGTVDTSRHLNGSGPDRTTPHGLLPPMQQETLVFERAHEAGFQWLLEKDTYRHDAWVNWQRLNTAAHREVFDAGIATRTEFRTDLALRADWHVAHQGGQKGGVEPVADSMAAAVGVEVGGPAGRFDRVSLELVGVGSRDVPDRQHPDATRSGFATFVRLALADAPWRAHLILWRGDDYIKTEGDPVYLSRRRDGSWYRGVRDYLELGASRKFTLAPDAFVETSARFHRVEDNYDFSIRIVGVAHLSFTLR
jgi:hypothetical protein